MSDQPATSYQLEQQLSAAGMQLADSILGALSNWVERCIAKFIEESSIPVLSAQISSAADDARSSIEGPLRSLLAEDMDLQASTPLSIVRTAVVFPTRVLSEAGVPPVTRDPFDERAFPHDIYGLSPAAFADLGPEVNEAGLRWSVAKAWAHRARHTGT